MLENIKETVYELTKPEVEEWFIDWLAEQPNDTVKEVFKLFALGYFSPLFAYSAMLVFHRNIYVRIPALIIASTSIWSMVKYRKELDKKLHIKTIEKLNEIIRSAVTRDTYKATIVKIPKKEKANLCRMTV